MAAETTRFLDVEQHPDSFDQHQCAGRTASDNLGRSWAGAGRQTALKRG